MSAKVVCGSGEATPVVPLKPVKSAPGSMNEIVIKGGFWGDLQEKNAAVIIPHEVKWLERFGTLKNFDRVVDETIVGNEAGRQFIDSDVYKVLEAIAWETGRQENPQLQQFNDELLARILPVVSPDGYINTRYGNPGQEARYSDMEWGHELYCFGHLIQAGVAKLRTGHDREDPLVNLSIKAADHVCNFFGQDGLNLVDGHPEIETALVELYRATGDQKYLEQANIFLDRRGHQLLRDIEFGRAYFQDDQPLREIEVMHGHSVRALYLAAGAIDAAVESDDAELFEKMQNQYLQTLAKRTYITGGMGSHHQDEAFGEDFELPSDRAYCETCAGVASIMVAWRLLLSTGNLSYGDIIERTLYNILATSVSEEGTAFFYSNPLHQRVNTTPSDPEKWSPRASSEQRAAWFEVPCCPPNLSRTVAQLASYVATRTKNSVQLIQYMSSEINMALEEGEVCLQVQTNYPYGSQVAVTVEAAPPQWQLDLRIPQWATEATVTVAGVQQPAQPGTFSVSNLQPGETLLLDLAIIPRFTYPDPRIDAIRGCVAVELGPLVMCAESVDQLDGADVSRILVDPTQLLGRRDNKVIAQGWVVDSDEEASEAWPYSGKRILKERVPADIVLSPYYQWANRGPSTMRIWLPVSK